MDSAQPIIVKKIKKGGHAHHGGAWKVAFADFVTAMMAFFMLMWLMGSTTPEERAAISDYFQNPSAVQGPGGASTSMIKLGKMDEKIKQDANKDKDEAQEKKQENQKEVTEAQDKKNLDSLKSELEAAISQSDALKDFKDQLLLDITPEGLRIQIIDKENRPMFASGSANLQEYTQTILREIATIINKVPNHISLTGHTDATPFRSMRGYTNWELSAERANASRRALVAGGLSEDKVAKVVGLSSTVLFDKVDPRNPVNRRISLIVLNKAAEEAIQSESAAQVDSAAAVQSSLQGAKSPAMLPGKSSVPHSLSNPIQLGSPITFQSPEVKPAPESSSSKRDVTTHSLSPIALPLKPKNL